MDIHLAKKLKDAGFPQNFQDLDWVICKHGKMTLYRSFLGEEDMFDSDCDKCNGNNRKDFIKFPGLDELIDECGDVFDSLYRDTDKEEISWVAYSSDKTGRHGYGETREEAVASLWLQL